MSTKHKTTQRDTDLKSPTVIAGEIIASLKKDSLYEQGKTIADISSSYIEMMNEINAAYLERLQELLKDFNDLNKEAKTVDEKFDLEKVRAKLEN